MDFTSILKQQMLQKLMGGKPTVETEQSQPVQPRGMFPSSDLMQPVDAPRPIAKDVAMDGLYPNPVYNVDAPNVAGGMGRNPVNTDEPPPFYPQNTVKPAPQDLGNGLTSEGFYPTQNAVAKTAPQNLGNGITTETVGNTPVGMYPQSRLDELIQQRNAKAAETVKDKDKGWRKVGSIVMEGLRGAGSTGGRGGIGGMLGGFIGGATRGIIDPTANEKLQKSKDLAEIDDEIGVLNKQREADAKVQNIYADNDLNNYKARTNAIVAEQRAKNAESRAAIAQYRNLPELDLNTPEGQAFAKEFEAATGLPALPKSAKSSSKYYFSEDGKVYLAQSDVTGKTSFAEVTNDDGSPVTFQTKGMRTSNDKELEQKFKAEEGQKNRAASITRTQILANAGITKTQIAQAGANYRNAQTLEFNKNKFAEQMRFRDEALRVGDQNKADQINATILRAKAAAKSDGWSDEDIKAMFGEN